MFACCGVIQEFTQKVRLLYGESLKSRAFRVYVAHAVAVAMTDACAEHHTLLGVYAITALKHLVDAVAVNVANAQLMEFGRPWCLVVTAPCIIVVEIAWCTAVPVVAEGKHIVVMRLSC